MTIALPFQMKRTFSPQYSRVKTPTILQMEAVECGAAALAIVMAYHGKHIPLEKLRIACGVSRNGSRASHLLRAARQHGFTAQGYKRSVEKALATNCPAIIFWNFNHFLVLEGHDKQRVYLNDPATGPRTVTHQEFDDAFTGVIIEFGLSDSFEKSGQAPSLLTALLSRLQGFGRPLTFLLLTSLLMTLVGLIVPSYTRIFVDQFLVAGWDNWLMPLFVGMGITVLALGVLNWLVQYYLLRLEIKLSVTTASRFVWHVLRMPSSFFQQRRSADIAYRIGLNDQIAQLLSGSVATNILNLFLIAFYLVLMARYDWLLTAIAATFAVVNVIALRIVSRIRKDANQRMLNEVGKLQAVAFSGLQIIETLKATGRETDFFMRWSGTQARAVNAEQTLSRSSELLAVVPTTLITLNTAMMLMIGGLRIMDGHLSFGELVAFQALAFAFMMPVNQLVNLGERLQRAQGEIVRLDDVINYEPDPRALASIDTKTVAPKLTGHLMLRNITFGYTRLEPPLLTDFNLTLTPGSRVALVGRSGSGKSTVAKLVAGIYHPDEGDILLDGKPVDEIDHAQLKQSLAFVDQDIYLYEGTSRENITLWDRTVPEPDVIRAAKDAEIHSTLAARRGGYEHIIAEGGTNLSGGQRQRLEIARALANNPTVLVLDEATSALDPVTEKRIDDNLRQRGCTCLIVAHRLSTIRDCDEIVVMEGGQVVQRGTHDSMIHVDGPYAKLIRTNEAVRADLNNLLDVFRSEPGDANG